MKKIHILLLFSFILSNVSAQVILNHRSNGLVAGDSSRPREIVFVEPGREGENQVWDFSGIQFTGKTTFNGITENLAVKSAGINEQNFIVSDDGYEYNFTSGEDGYRETGYVNNGKKLTLNYSSPVVRMQYPFSYGEHFSNPFSGVAWVNNVSRIDVGGVYTVKADAFGTLILPDRILKNTLRVTTTKQYLQTSVCGSTQSNIIKYCWFSPGYRYPVLTLMVSENTYSGREPVIVKSAWLNVNQHASDARTSAVISENQSTTPENSVIVFPNPFSEQVTYNYFLRNQVHVSVELYDMSGKFNILVEKKSFQSEGLHTGTLNALDLGLSPGVYYLRFMFDKQVFVSKLVKI